MTSDSRTLAVKVPAITAFFWIIKILATTVGETFADFLNQTLGWGLSGTAVAMTLFLVVVLVVQFSLRRYIPAVYWLAIVTISTVGTLLTDWTHDGLGVENWQAIIVFAIALAITLIVWYLKERTLAMKSINTRPREAFYWLAMLFTFALGTAGGDIFLDDMGIPLTVTLIGFALALLLLLVLWRVGVVGSVLAFWIACVLTRPLGAALGDLLSSPADETGLGWGAATTSYLFLAIIAGLIVYMSITKRDQIKA
jgi:uncharacterized membrane-anchored protein